MMHEDALQQKTAERSITRGMANAPTFSVVMPAYNAARSIGVAIESVLAQTRGDFELIVVDDGSEDETSARVEQYMFDSRVKLIAHANAGQAVARNAAVKAARGTYVSLLDSDDLWLPTYLEGMGRALDTDPLAAVAYTDAWVLDDETRRIARITAMHRWQPRERPRDPRQVLWALLEGGNFIFVGATIRRSTIIDVGLFRPGIEGSEDYELWLRIAARGYRFVRHSSPLAIYRRSPQQMSASTQNIHRAANEVFRIVAEEYDVPEEIRELARQRLPITRSGSRPPRSVPRMLKRPYRALARLRRFRLIPPKQVRDAFPNLRSL
jgi:glycosyltransferase involved in cell wall biosynthesis